MTASSPPGDPCPSLFIKTSHMRIPVQVCGAAQYVDDIKLPPGALHAALVLSTRPHARILRIDTAAAAAMPGVHGVYTGGWAGGSVALWVGEGSNGGKRWGGWMGGWVGKYVKTWADRVGG